MDTKNSTLKMNNLYKERSVLREDERRLELVLKSLKSKRKTVEGTKIKVGMTLVDKEGNYIGPVKEVHRKGFKVDRSKMHADDLFVPYSACVHDGPDQLKLEVKTTEAEQKDWPEADCA